MKEYPTIHNVFKNELQWFDSDIVRVWVCDVFHKLCPSYFWHIAASSTAGHHPPICRLHGGLVHHVKLAMRFAKDFAEMWEDEMSIEDRDMIYAGVLLHDMLKRGRTERYVDTFDDHKHYQQGHGRYCAYQILERGLVHRSWQHEIIKAVSLHMGRWTIDLMLPEKAELENNIIVKSVHLADYAASRSLHKWLAERNLDESMRYLY